MVCLWILLVCLAANASSQRLRHPAPVQEPRQEYQTYPDITVCPDQEGLQLYHHPLNCDQFYKCANGTLTLETCENGLLFDGNGAVHNYCNYHWAVDCQGREFELVSIGKTNCEYAFGVFPAAPCENYYNKCEYGKPIPTLCIDGLAYDDRIHGCNWPDLMETCNAEAFLGFSCPEYIDPKDLASRFIPFPRFVNRSDSSKYFICVEGKPRLVGCGHCTVFNPQTLTCDYAPKCDK